MINLYGCGTITAINKKSGKSPYFLATLSDNSSSAITIKAPYSFKSLMIENERVNFDGYLNEEGIVEVNNLSRAYLEPLGFNFVSSNEVVFSFSSKGLVLKVDVKTPKHSLTHKTFEFLAKAGNNDVLNRLVGVLNNKKISLRGIFKNNVGMLTALGATC